MNLLNSSLRALQKSSAMMSWHDIFQLCRSVKEYKALPAGVLKLLGQYHRLRFVFNNRLLSN